MRLSLISFVLSLISIVLSLLVLTGCTLPNAPSNKGYKCSTQPRLYTLPSGEQRLEVDTYWQREACPPTPIF